MPGRRFDWESATANSPRAVCGNKICHPGRNRTRGAGRATAGCRSGTAASHAIRSRPVLPLCSSRSNWCHLLQECHRWKSFHQSPVLYSLMLTDRRRLRMTAKRPILPPTWSYKSHSQASDRSASAGRTWSEWYQVGEISARRTHLREMLVIRITASLSGVMSPCTGPGI